MNETNKKYIAWIIVVIAVLVAGFLGVTYPIPAPPTSPLAPPSVVSQALISGGIKCHSVGPTGNCVEIWNGGDVRVYSNQGTTSKFSVDGATGDTTIAGSLAVSGSTVDGGVIGNNTAITGTLTVTGATSLVGIATTTAGVAVGGNLTVTGATSLVGIATTTAGVAVGGNLTVTGATVLNGGLAMDTNKFTVADTSGNTSVGGTLAVAGVTTFSGFNIYNSASITPTDGGILTPTASLVTLTPAAALGAEMGACTSGQKTILYNSINADVVITDTANGVLAGNQTLGQYDTLPLVCIGAKWVQVGPVSTN